MEAGRGLPGERAGRIQRGADGQRPQLAANAQVAGPDGVGVLGQADVDAIELLAGHHQAPVRRGDQGLEIRILVPAVARSRRGVVERDGGDLRRGRLARRDPHRAGAVRDGEEAAADAVGVAHRIGHQPADGVRAVGERRGVDEEPAVIPAV